MSQIKALTAGLDMIDAALLAPRRKLECLDCGLKMDCICGKQAEPDHYYHDPAHSHFGDGATRCKPCADKFNHAWREKDRLAKEAAAKRHLDSNHEDGEVCEECCAEHERDPDEGMMCLLCGAEWDGP